VEGVASDGVLGRVSFQRHPRIRVSNERLRDLLQGVKQVTGTRGHMGADLPQTFRSLLQEWIAQ
jgi:hypothetical protein